MSRTSTQLATFAGGCFWCLEPAFAQLPGIVALTVGYTGGNVPNPTYEQVCRGTTGHLEAIQVEFRPEEVSYEELLQTFWRQIDPTDPDGQFADKGESYQTAIFFHSAEQQKAAEQSKQVLEEAKIYPRPIVTRITAATEFYPAEEYHQAYYKKNPVQYGMYSFGSGRKSYVEELWHDREFPKNK